MAVFPPTVSNVALAHQFLAPSGTTTLTWAVAANSNTISKIRVYRSINGAAYELLSELAATAISLSVTGPATAGQYHRYYVVAIGSPSSGEGYSGYLYAYKAPGAPTGLTFNPASVVQGQKSTLSWTASAAGVGVSISKYEVYLGGTKVGETTGTSLKITAPGTVGTHNYTVRAIGSVSGYNSANSTAKSLTTTAAPAPVMGAVSLAVGYVAANGSTTLSWSATANATNPIVRYAVYRSIAGAAYAHLGNTTGTSMSVTGPGTAGSNHRYYVVAVGTYSNSGAAYSGYLYAYKAPGAPTGVNLSPTSVFTGATSRLSWAAGAEGVGVSTSSFDVFRAGIYIGSTTGLYMDVTAPTTAGSYAYTVRAIGSINGYNSALSSGATLSAAYPPSTGSLDKSSVPMDGASTIKVTIAPYSSAFNHKAIWKAGIASVTQNVAAGVASTTLTVPLAWCAQFPNSDRGDASVVLETYNGATKVGENTYTFTVTVPASVEPSFTALTASIVANGIAITNRYVQGYSSVSLAITSPAGAQGSSITKYAITGGGFTAAASQTTTFGKLNTAGTITFTGTITDSRGRTASKTASITVQPYSAPSLSGVLAYRCNSSGTKAANGLYVLLRATNVIASVDGQNTATLQGRVYMKGATPGAWQGMSSNANLITGGGGILIIKTYYAEIRITDKINNYVYTATIPTDSILFHGLDNVAGAAIGKYAETPNALEIPEDWSFRRGGYVGLDSGNYSSYVTAGGIGAAPSVHNHIELYARTDNRSVATIPNDYNNYFRVAGLKQVSAVNNPMSGLYVGLIGFRQWGDSSGGPATELAFGDEGIAFRQGLTTTWGGWNRLLHSGNYTDYTVTKTGGGASGTWGISITGNAATATTATTANAVTWANVSGKPASMPASDVSAWAKASTKPSYTYSEVGSANVRGRVIADYNHADFTVSGMYGESGTASNSPGGSYKALIVARNSDTGLQITGGHTIDKLWFRGWHTSGATFTSWREVHHSGNYTDYTVTKTGSGASGTWPISITGTAAVASSVAWANVSGKPASMPASDVSAWAKAATKPTYTAAEVGAATSGHNHDTWYLRLTGWTNDLNSRILGTGFASANYAVYGPCMTFGVGTNYGAQLNTTHSNLTNPSIYFRTYYEESSVAKFSSWANMIHSLNYNSYSPTLTGTGASGTWPISITGNAASASSVTWANVSGKPASMPASAEAITPTAGTGFTLSDVAAYRVGNIVLLHFSAYGSYSGNGSSTVATISTAYCPLKLTKSPTILSGSPDSYSYVTTAGNVYVVNQGAQLTTTAYVSIIYAI